MSETQTFLTGVFALGTLGTLIMAVVAVRNWVSARAASRPIVEVEAAWLARGQVRLLVTVRNRLPCSLALTRARLARPWLGRLQGAQPDGSQDRRAGRARQDIGRVLAPVRADGSYARASDMLELVVEMPRWRLGDRVLVVLTGRAQDLRGRRYRWRVVARPQGPQPAAVSTTRA